MERISPRKSDQVTESQDQQNVINFNIGSASASKQPQQLVALLERTLRDEFPESLDIVEISQLEDSRVVSLKNLENLESNTVKRLVQRARAVFMDFMNSPWY